MQQETGDWRARAFLVGLKLPGAAVLDSDASLEELALLADTAGLHVVGQTTQRLRHPDPATFIGSGKVEEVRHWVEELAASFVIFDDELSPRHQRELEDAFGEDVTVLDRTALILDIFAQHAHTREGALQVELAQYQYRLPRLTRQWTHLARQAGGGTARGGAAGVGLRGPGETQLEADRRDIRKRIAQLEHEIERVRAHRERHRAQRRRSGTPVVALVGYTNAGKSTLLNRLSGSDVYVADQLFATLDPTTRRVSLPGGRVVLFTDTVGFIQKLPHTLVAAFRATLEEITEASILLHVVDASHPNALEQVTSVQATLQDELAAEGIPTLTALNKVDLVDDDSRDQFQSLREAIPGAIPISALQGRGLEHLLERVEEVCTAQHSRITVQLPYEQAALIARFHDVAAVETEVRATDHVRLTGTLDARYLSAFEPYRVRKAR